VLSYRRVLASSRSPGGRACAVMRPPHAPLPVGGLGSTPPTARPWRRGGQCGLLVAAGQCVVAQPAAVRRVRGVAEGGACEHEEGEARHVRAWLGLGSQGLGLGAVPLISTLALALALALTLTLTLT
jgi:hypothetical protein